MLNKVVSQVLILMLLGSSVVAGPRATEDEKSLATVTAVDLARYAGRWYEIARLPNRFQKKCVDGVTATYEQLDDGEIKVVNACRTKTKRLVNAEGRAKPADRRGPNSKLRVRFAPAWLGWIPLVWGDYWIIDLAPDYSYSVVGTPDRKYLWILSRSPNMDEKIYVGIVERAAGKGFDTSRLTRTQQN